VKPQSALVGPDGVVELDPESPVHMDPPLVIGPGHLKGQYPVGLNQSLDNAGRFKMRIFVVYFLDRFEDFMNRLVKFHLPRIFLDQVIHNQINIHSNIFCW